MTILVIVMVVSLFLCLTVDNVLCFSMPRSIKRVTNKSPLRMNMNTNLVKVEQENISIEQDKISIEQENISLRREELALEEKKMNQDKEMGVMKLKQDKDQRREELKFKIIVQIFAIFSFIAFSVQLKDGLLGQATTLNSYLKYFSSSFNELKAWIYGGLATITGIVIIKPLYNALNYLNKMFGKYLRIILDRVVKWRRSLS